MKRYNLIVIGGGLSGVAAAVASAREGFSVLLVEKNGCLGGASSNCLVNPFMRYKIKKTGADGPDSCEILNRGIFLQILERLKGMDGLKGDGVFNEEYLKLILENLCAEKNIEILYHTVLIGVYVKEGYIKSVKLYNKNGLNDYFADYFIDASGDAELSYLSGVPCKAGREQDGLCQPMTLCFRLGNVDMEAFEKEQNLINPLYKSFRENKKIANPRENVLIFSHTAPGVLHFNTTRVVKKSPLDARQVTQAQIEARKQVFEMFYFLKENFQSFKSAELLMTAAEIGIRESRKIEGEYTLCKEDILSYKIFEDSLACGAYEIDIHSPDGTGTKLVYLEPGKYYTIPYRSLIPKGIKNMLVAGRCISSTHEAQSAYRVMPIICNIGEGAGAAIAECLKKACETRNADIKSIQSILAAQGARYH